MAIFEHLQPQQLLAGCRNVKVDKSHEAFCLELFRRAVVGKSQECWAALYEQYVKLVYFWTIEYAKRKTAVGSSSIEDLVQETFTTFWRAYSPSHFAKAAALGSVLKFLKSCAWSSVQHAVRKVKAQQEDDRDISNDEVAIVPVAQPMFTEQQILTNVAVEELWQAVEACCNNESEKKIARLRFVEGLKPKEIMVRHPDLVQTENEVYKLLRNIKDRMDRNLYIQELRKDWAV